MLKLECFSSAHSRAFVTVPLHKLGEIAFTIQSQYNTFDVAVQFLDYWLGGISIDQVSNLLAANLSKLIRVNFTKYVLMGFAINSKHAVLLSFERVLLLPTAWPR